MISSYDPHTKKVSPRNAEYGDGMCAGVSTSSTVHTVGIISLCHQGDPLITLLFIWKPGSVFPQPPVSPSMEEWRYVWYLLIETRSVSQFVLISLRAFTLNISLSFTPQNTPAWEAVQWIKKGSSLYSTWLILPILIKLAQPSFLTAIKQINNFLICGTI